MSPGRNPNAVLTSPPSGSMLHLNMGDPLVFPPFFLEQPIDNLTTERTPAGDSRPPPMRSPSRGSSVSALSWTPTPMTSATPATSVNSHSKRGSQETVSEDIDEDFDSEAFTDLDTDEDTDAEDSIINVIMACKGKDGVAKDLHIDIRETELLAGQEQGYAYIGIEHLETEEQSIARGEAAKKAGWMDGWLARQDLIGYQHRPRKWVPNDKRGGRRTEVDTDKPPRVNVEWKKAIYEDKRWFVEQAVAESEHTRMERLRSPQVRYKIEVKRPRAPLFCDRLTGRPPRFQPPIMGTFSEEQEKLYDGKEWPIRCLTTMRSERHSKRHAHQIVDKTESR